jgi:predicted dehydrogenase
MDTLLPMTRSTLRWGILGAANVARKNWRAIRLAGNATLAGVASRDATRARQFVDECQAEVPFPTVPEVFDSYEALIASPAIDAIYCPLPTGVRREWIVRAAAAGKHVLCEKPCAPSTADLRAMMEACQANGVQFMDGVMFAHSRRIARVLELIHDGTTVGKVRHIASQFSWLAPENFGDVNIRSHAVLEPQGCLGDLGWYCIRLVLLVVRGQLPERVTARCLDQAVSPGAPAPVPAEVSVELVFPGGLTASFHCSFRCGMQQWAHIAGTHGSIYLPDYVLPFAGESLGFEVSHAEFVVKGCEFRMEPNIQRHEVEEASHGRENAPETNLFRTFSQQALCGKPDPFWPEIALKTQRVLDACMESVRRDATPVSVA